MTTWTSNLVGYTRLFKGMLNNLAFLKSKTDTITSVTTFGAVGDGVTDDYAALQAAIDSAGAGGTVIIPPTVSNVYCISQSLKFYPSQTIRSSAGLDVLGAATQIKLTASSTSVLEPKTPTTTTRDVKIEGLYLNAQGFAPIGLSLYNCSYCNISIAAATTMAGAASILLDANTTLDCYFNEIHQPRVFATGVGAVGIRFTRGANVNQVYGGKLGSSTRGAEFLSNSSGNLLLGVDFEDNTDTHVYVDAPSNIIAYCHMESVPTGITITSNGTNTQRNNNTYATTVTTNVTDSSKVGSVLDTRIETAQTSGDLRFGAAKFLSAYLSSVTRLDYDPDLSASNSNALVRFFLNTNSTGTKQITLYKGNGTSTYGINLNAGTGEIVVGDMYQSTSGDSNGILRRIIRRTVTPTIGTWAVGDICFYTAPKAGGALGSVCTVTGTPGTWKSFSRIEDQDIWVEDYGITGDGTTDDSAAWIAAAAVAAATNKGLKCQVANSYVSSQISLLGIPRIYVTTIIKTNPALTVPAILLGGFATGRTCSIQFNDITNGTSTVSSAAPTYPIIRIQGIKSSEITIGSCNYIQVYADAATASISSTAYNRIYLNGATTKFEITDSGVANSWCNENRIYGGRLQVVYITGVGYAHNHNKFYEPTFEGANVDIELTKTYSNQLYGCRFESTNTSNGVFFASDTYSNTILSTWSGIGNPKNQFTTNYITTTDNGSGNMVATESSVLFNKTKIVDFNSTTPHIANTFSSCTDCVTTTSKGYGLLPTDGILIPSLAGVEYPANVWVALTPYIPVSVGNVLTFEAEFFSGGLRPVIHVYDSKQAPLTSEGAGGVYVSTAAYTFNTTWGFYAPGTNQTSVDLRDNPACIVRSEVAYIRLGFYSSSAGVAKSISAFLHTKAMGEAKSEIFKPVQQLMCYSQPNRGFFQRYTRVLDPYNAREWWVNNIVDTFLSSDIQVGGTTATVVTITGVNTPYYYGILRPDGTTLWGQVGTITGNSFTIPASTQVIPSGSRVVFTGWTYRLLGVPTYSDSAMDSSKTTSTVNTVLAFNADYKVLMRNDGTRWIPQAPFKVWQAPSSFTWSSTTEGLAWSVPVPFKYLGTTGRLRIRISATFTGTTTNNNWVSIRINNTGTLSGTAIWVRASNGLWVGNAGFIADFEISSNSATSHIICASGGLANGQSAAPTILTYDTTSVTHVVFSATTSGLNSDTWVINQAWIEIIPSS